MSAAVAYLSPHAACAVMAGEGLGDNAMVAILREVAWREVMGGKACLHSELAALIERHRLP